MFRGRRAFGLISGLLVVGGLMGSGVRAQPLDVDDPTPRAIQVELDVSGNPEVVGQSYGDPVVATYSASGGVGTVVIPAGSHELLRPPAFPGAVPLPGTFDPIVIEIDLADGSATSQPASGAMAGGNLGFGFGMGILDTQATLGFVSGNNLPPLACTSQQQIDDTCPVIPLFCGATCVFVPGQGYDPGSGKIHLVGIETQEGCDGAVCQGPFAMFSTAGDLRFTDAAPVPMLGDGALVPLFGLALLGLGLLAVRGQALVSLTKRSSGSMRTTQSSSEAPAHRNAAR